MPVTGDGAGGRAPRGDGEARRLRGAACEDSPGNDRNADLCCNLANDSRHGEEAIGVGLPDGACTIRTLWRGHFERFASVLRIDCDDVSTMFLRLGGQRKGENPGG